MGFKGQNGDPWLILVTKESDSDNDPIKHWTFFGKILMKWNLVWFFSQNLCQTILSQKLVWVSRIMYHCIEGDFTFRNMMILRMKWWFFYKLKRVWKMGIKRKITTWSLSICKMTRQHCGFFVGNTVGFHFFSKKYCENSFWWK